MKVHALAAVALGATILVENVESFTPNNLSQLTSRLPEVCRAAGWSSLPMSSIPTLSSGDIAFPYDDDEVRSAYDEWRFMYNKGPFDAIRFEQFKSNYVALTVENLRARREAVDTGRQAPEWRKLNEFGDFSMEEFEAYKRGVPLGSPLGSGSAPKVEPSPTEIFPMYDADNSRRTMAVVGAGSSRSTMPVPLDSSRKTIAISGDSVVGGPVDPGTTRSTLPVPQDSSRRTIAITGDSQMEAPPVTQQEPGPSNLDNDAQVRASYDDCRSAYLSWCEKYGKEADAVRFATFSSNYLAMKEYSDKTGRALNLNAYADCTKEEYDQIGQAGSAPTVNDNSAQTDFQGRPTQSMPEGSPRPTMVVQKGPGPVTAQAGPRATQVVQRGDPSVRSTQVLQSGSGAPLGGFPPRATQVVQPARPTVVMPSSNSGSPVRSTQVIQQASDPTTSSTQVIQSANDSNRSVRETMFVSGKNTSEEPSGFQKMVNSFGFSWGDNDDDDDEDDENSPRGGKLGRSTIVIKRKIVEREPANPFATYATKANLSPAPSEARATQVIGGDGEADQSPGSSIMSLFGGEGKSSENPRPVRGTIRIEQSSQRQPSYGPRKTILIDKQKDGQPETIFSFFGGAKKPDDRGQGGRPTITINKKDDNMTMSSFSYLNYGST